MAVLPTIDWSEREGCIHAYTIYGLSGILGVREAYPEAGYLITNEITRSLWKKNAMFLVNQQEIFDAMNQFNLTREQVFPQHDYMTCTRIPKPIENPSSLGKGTPDYERLFDLGQELNVDIVIISRLTKNSDAGVLPQTLGFGSPLSAFVPLPFYVYPAISLAQWGYRTGVKNIRTNYIAIDIMALDVKNRDIIAFGGYNMIDQIARDQKEAALQDYTDALTFYAPMPDEDDLRREFLAKTGSQVGTYIANFFLQTFTGLTIGLSFEFQYEYGDETWKMYPENHFDDNYGWTVRDFRRLF